MAFKRSAVRSRLSPPQKRDTRKCVSYFSARRFFCAEPVACGRLFVPDLTFGKHIEMGENVFFYMGEMAECYVIYWPGKPVTEVHHGEM